MKTLHHRSFWCNLERALILAALSIVVPQLAFGATPNNYELANSANTLSISYSTTGFDGQAHFTYRDGSQTLNFSGNQIRSQATEMGTVVTVTLNRILGFSATDFTVLIPRINLDDQTLSTADIITLGIRTVHRYPILPQFSNGQLDTYNSIRLLGIASQVSFFAPPLGP